MSAPSDPAREVKRNATVNREAEWIDRCARGEFPPLLRRLTAMRRPPRLVFAFAAFAAFAVSAAPLVACANVDLVRTSHAATHGSRAPSDVAILDAPPPERRYAVVGTFIYSALLASREELVVALRRAAAQEGCDAVLVTGDAESPRCLVFADAAE